MGQNRKERMRARLEPVAEYGIGLFLLTKGWEMAEHFDRFPVRVVLIFLAAVVVIAGAGFRRPLEKTIKDYGALFHIVEGVVEILCASILLEEGKHWIPMFLAFIGLSYLSGGLVQFLTSPGNRERAQRRFRTVLAVAFCVFAVATSVFNALTDRKVEVYAVGGILILAGVLILKKMRARKTPS